MRFVNQIYYLPSVYRAISNAAASSTKDFGQALQNSNRRRKGANK